MKNLPPSATLEEHTWQGMDHFLSSTSLGDGIHRIRLQSDEGRPASIEFYLHLTPGTSLAVHFYGAQSYRKLGDTPIFKGYRTSENLDTSYALIHDPALSLTTEIGLGWYEGFRGFAASGFITAAMTHVGQVARAPRTILWGGSAGGYASLRNVGAIPNSIAFVWNAQSSIARYKPSPVRRYAQAAFGAARLQQGIAETTGHVIDLTTQASPNWTDSNVVYLQEADDSHVKTHLSYLLRNRFPEVALEVTRRDTIFGLLDPHFYLHLSPWKPGHSAPPQPVIQEFLRALVDLNTPLGDVLSGLYAQSRYLLHHTHKSYRDPLITELDSTVFPREGTATALQWGSRFGQRVLAETSRTVPLTVKRNILGQSIIATYSRRKKPIPKTSLLTHRAQNNEHWRMMLGDRNASAKHAIETDRTIQAVVIDMLEEVRGTVNAGNGFIVTNHKLMRRVDRGSMVRHEFGSERHQELWRSRISRLSVALNQSNAHAIIVDVDATHLTPDDWAWLGVPEPTASTTQAWISRMDDARSLLTDATWIEVGLNGEPLSERIESASELVANAMQRNIRSLSSARKSS